MSTVDRLQMYALVYWFERDIREILRRYIDIEERPEKLLGKDQHSLVMERALKDNPEAAPFSLEEYLDLQPSYDLLNKSSALLPAGLASEVRKNTPLLAQIVPIRQRLMHARPLRPDDGATLTSALSCFTNPSWKNTKRTIDKLSDSAWIPDVQPEVLPDKILHNLPAPDYDETGLIGRDREVAQIADMLVKGRENVVTLIGEGGIGKTALALEVAYSLLDRPDTPFEAILWVTLKQERLTGDGVQEIRAAISSLTDAAGSIGRVVDSNFAGEIDSLAEILNGIPTLICFDNLETVSGSEFITLYESLPADVKFLVTSRLGIGQIERRCQVGPLSRADALRFLNKIAKSRSVSSILTLSEEKKYEAVEALRFSPLAIKWWVMAAAVGRPAGDLLASQSELLTFCLQSVFLSLPEPARQMALALDVLSGEVSLHRLMYLLNLDLTSAQHAMQQLVRSSMVLDRIDMQADMDTLIRLTETARRYLRIAVPSDDLNRIRIIESQDRFNKGEELRLKEMSERALNPNVVRHRTGRDVPVCQVLRDALENSRGEDWNASLEKIERAREMAPDFWEVDRVEAFIRSYRDSPAVVSAIYVSALEKADTPEARGICSYFYSSFLSSKMSDHERALTYAQEALNLLGLVDIDILIGNIYLRSGKYNEAIDCLSRIVDSAEGLSRTIALTSLIGALSRFSDSAAQVSHDFGQAVEYARRAVTLGIEAMSQGIVDQRLANSTASALTSILRHEKALQRAGLDPVRVAWPAEPEAFLTQMYSTRSWEYLFLEMKRAGNSVLNATSLRTLLDISDVQVPRGDGEFLGVVHSILGGFGFISCAEFPSNVFFHKSSVKGFEFDALCAGDSVVFEVEDPRAEKPRAEAVRLA